MLIQNKLLILHHLYTMEMLGESFCQEIDFKPNPISTQTKTLGFNPCDSKIGFISQTPLIDERGNFLPKKSSQMLENIIQKVFFLQKEQCSILSLFKINTNMQENIKDLDTYREILLAQINQSNANVFVIFGLNEVAEILFGKTNLELGSPFKYKNKTFIITHPFKALNRLEHLKKQTLQHLKNIKELII